MLYTLADSSFFDLVERVDPDIIGAMGILTVIMVFTLSIVSVVTVSRTIQNVSLARMHRQMINEMLAKGYSIDEIQQLVTGRRKSVFSRFFDGRRQEYVNNAPSPPLKTSI